MKTCAEAFQKQGLIRLIPEKTQLSLIKDKAWQLFKIRKYLEMLFILVW